MTRQDGTVNCGACGRTFSYVLVHNGFNDSAYAYCDGCGRTALFNCHSQSAPQGIEVGYHGPLRVEAEQFVQPCACGGHFRGAAAPRCPHCRAQLSAKDSAEYIEPNAAGTSKGWRWQRTWTGPYAIVIGDRFVQDPWQ
jgi:hypothetical protein